MFQRRNIVMGLASGEIFGTGCLITHGVVVIAGIANPMISDQVNPNAGMHIIMGFRVESNGVVHQFGIGLGEYGEIVGVQDPMGDDQTGV